MIPLDPTAVLAIGGACILGGILGGFLLGLVVGHALGLRAVELLIGPDDLDDQGRVEFRS